MAYITLNKKYFFNNLDIIANRTKSKDKIAIVLKDNAYGHGLLQIAAMAKEYGLTKAIVRTCKEAGEIVELFDFVLVLCEIPVVPHPRCIYSINDIHSIGIFPKGTRVELKVDTGMHRNGIAINELSEAFSKIKKAGLNLEAFFTHHRSADELTSEWFWQNDEFKKVKEESRLLADEFGFSSLRFHSANSASLFRTNNFDEDMIRVGLAVYGCMDGLKPVLSLYGNKISSRELKVGQRVGYGATCRMDEDAIVSNYDFGYGDGFLRVCSNSYTAPNGEKLVGKISMDNSSFISKSKNILIFDDAREMAKSAKTISYEVLTSLKSSMKREIV